MQNGFVWILLSVAGYGILHSIFAGLPFKQWVSRRLGQKFYHRFYRIFFSLQAGFLFLPILYLVAVLPDQPIYRITMPWVLFTAAVQIAAVLLILHSIMLTGAMRFIGLHQALDPVSGQQTLPLVNRGMYRYVRHPLYTLTFVVIWLVPVMSWNILALNIGITFYTLIGAIFEERKLLREFGSAYEEYRQKTPFIVPGVKFL